MEGSKAVPCLKNCFLFLRGVLGGSSKAAFSIESSRPGGCRFKGSESVPAEAFDLETSFNAEEAAIHESMRPSAKGVLRLLGRCEPAEVVAPGPSCYSPSNEFAKSGPSPSLLAELPPNLQLQSDRLPGHSRRVFIGTGEKHACRARATRRSNLVP